MAQSFFSSVKEAEKIVLSRNLSTMIKAGLPLSRALDVSERQTKNKKLQSVLRSVNREVTGGGAFHEALGKFPKVFSPLFVSMVKAGEESGKLSEALSMISRQMNRTYQLKRKVRGALIYPAIIVVAMIGIGILMLVYVVPTLSETFEELGARGTEAFRAADPYSAAIAQQQQNLAERLYAQSEMVTPEQQRMAQQQARAASLSRGRLDDSSGIAAEILGREDVLSRKRAEAQQAGQLSFGMSRSMGDPMMAILGRPSTSMQYGIGQQQIGIQQALGPTGPQYLDPNAGINLALANQQNIGSYNASIYGAQSALAGARSGAQASIYGGLAQGLGSMAGGFAGKCWVAREVYGNNNPRWLMFREWLTNRAPKWFHDLYVKHGERFAKFVSSKPLVKRIIRKWMDSRIATLGA